MPPQAINKVSLHRMWRDFVVKVKKTKRKREMSVEYIK